MTVTAQTPSSFAATVPAVGSGSDNLVNVSDRAPPDGRRHHLDEHHRRRLDGQPARVQPARAILHRHRRRHATRARLAYPP